MQRDDDDVATTRFTCPAHGEAETEIPRKVSAFALAHGITETARTAMAAAVTEAIRNAARHAYPAGTHGTVAVDAATDGRWLTVQVSDRGRGGIECASFGRGMPLMTRLADRLEASTGWRGTGTTILMEFAMWREGHAGTVTRPRLVTSG